MSRATIRSRSTTSSSMEKTIAGRFLECHPPRSKSSSSRSCKRPIEQADSAVVASATGSIESAAVEVEDKTRLLRDASELDFEDWQNEYDDDADDSSNLNAFSVR